MASRWPWRFFPRYRVCVLPHWKPAWTSFGLKNCLISSKAICGSNCVLSWSLQQFSRYGRGPHPQKAPMIPSDGIAQFYLATGSLLMLLEKQNFTIKLLSTGNSSHSDWPYGFKNESVVTPTQSAPKQISQLNFREHVFTYNATP